MKTKHLQKNFISSMYAILISLIFFLLPLGARAQLGGTVIPDCVVPPTNADCCVNSAYLSEVTGCYSYYVVNMDGEVWNTDNGMDWVNVASVNTRLMTTLKEVDNELIEFRTYLVGPCFINAIEHELLFDRTTLIPCNNTTRAAIAIGPKGVPEEHSGFSARFTKGILSGYNYSYKLEKLDDVHYGRLHITVDNASLTSTAVTVQEGKVQPLYTIYFKKAVPGTPLTSDSFGFMGDDLGMVSMILSSYPICGYANSAIRMTQQYPGTPTSHIAMPNVFEYRYPSDVVTNQVLMANSKNAELSGTFQQGGGYTPLNSLPVVTFYDDYTWPPTPVPESNFTIEPFGLANWDKIFQYGFIYTSVPISTPYAPGADPVVTFNTYKDFETAFSITVDGNTVPFDIDDLLAGVPLKVTGTTLGDIEFYVVLSGSDVAGDYSSKIPVDKNYHYYYWAFSLNGYSTLDTFLNVGKRAEFDAVDCMDEPDLHLNGTLCDASPYIEILNYSDYITGAGGSTVVFEWYDADDNLVGNDAPIFSLAGKEPGTYKLVVSSNIWYEDPLFDPSLCGWGSTYPHCPDQPGYTGHEGYCETEGFIDVDPCGGPFTIEQIFTDPVCSGDNFLLTIAVTNYGAGTHDFVMNVLPDADLSEGPHTVDAYGSYGGGVWVVTGLGPDETTTLEIEYTATNTGNDVVSLKHKVEIVEYDLATVDTDKIISDEVEIEVIPEPTVLVQDNLFVCNGTPIDAIAVDGVYTYFDLQVQVGDVGLGTTIIPNITEIPAFVAVNNGTTAPITGEIWLTPYYVYGGVPCPGVATKVFEVTVYPIPVTVAPINATYCDGDEVEIDFPDLNGTTAILDIEYRWERIGGFDFGLGTTSGVNMIAFDAENTGTLPLVALYQVTPYYVGTGVECVGASQNFLLTVNPQPEIAPVINRTYCVGEQVPAYIFTGNVPGATYYWENTGATMPEITANGYDILPTFTATTVGTHDFKVWMSYSFANESCKDSVEFTITINPIPTVISVTDKSYCNNEAVTIDLSYYATTGSTVHWEVIGGDQIGLASMSGTNTIAFPAMNTSAVVLSTDLKVTATLNGCVSEPRYFTISVMPEMQIDMIEPFVVCSQTAIPTINFTGKVVDASYYWSVDNTTDAQAIGMIETTGHDFVPGFTAHNYTTAPITVTITAYSYMDNNSRRCESIHRDFTITVYPEVTVMQEDDVNLCDGDPFDIPLYGAPAGAIYEWVASSNAALVGLPLFGNNNVGDGLINAVNTTTSPITVQITVTPTYQVPGGLPDCHGEPMTFNITVHPMIPDVNVMDQEYCAGEQTPVIEFTGPIIQGTNYYWWWDDNDVIPNLPFYGYGSIPTFLAENNGDVPLVGSFYAWAMGDYCYGDPVPFTITVNPRPIMEPVSSVTVCDAANVVIPFTSSMTTNVTYNWYVDNNVNATTIGMDLSDLTINPIDFTAANTTDNPITVVVTVTPSYVGANMTCVGEPFTFSITVSPEPAMQPVVDQVVCVGDLTAGINFGATTAPAGTIFYWDVTGADIGLPLTGTGNIPPFTVTAAGTAAVTVTADYTNASSHCTGSVTETFEITGVERPFMYQPENITLCNGETASVEFGSSATTPVYTWRFVSGINFVDGGDIYGNDTYLDFTGVNLGTTALSGVYGVKVSEGGYCESEEIFFVITVNPTPEVAPVAEEVTYCHGDHVPAYTFTGNTVGATYHWVQTNTIDGTIPELPTEGYDVLPAFTVNNTTIDPIVLTYTVTAVFGTNGAGTPCEGTDADFTIILNHLQEVTPMPNVTVCAGGSIDVDPFIGGADKFFWQQISGDVIVAGDLFTGNWGDMPSLTGLNTGTTPLVATIQVTPWSDDEMCSGNPITFTITVNPTPEMTAVEDKTFCAGEQVPAIVFTAVNPGTTFEWTITGAIPGLPATGYGDIPTFLAVNTTNAPIVGNVVVTPYFGTCPGTPEPFDITINPVPVMDPVSNQNLCAGGALNVAFTSNIDPDVQYDWYVDNNDNATAIGMTSNGTGDITVVSVANTTDNPITVVVTVTPWSFDGTDELCAGEPITFSITVSPVPETFDIADQVVCVEEWTAAIDFGATNAPAGTKFYWTNSDNAIGLPLTGTGNIPSFKVLDNVIATITVHAEYPNGAAPCGDALNDINFTITGVDRPVMDPIENITLCNTDTDVVTFASATPVTPIYTWRFVSGINFVTGGTLYDSGVTSVAFTGVNTGTVALSGVYGVKVSDDGYCESEEVFFVVTVNPTPEMTAVEDKTFCAGEQVPAIVFTADAPGTTFEWAITGAIPGLPATGYGDIPTFPAVNTTNAPIVGNVVVTPYYGECPGTPVPFDITINPVPVMDPVSNQNLCAGGALNVAFTSNIDPNVQYDWYVDNNDNATAIGMTASNGTGNITVASVTNTTDNPITVVITVTPWSFDGTNELCAGEPITFSITVSPIPEMQPVVDQVVCVGDMTAAVDFGATHAPEGTIFYWTASGTSMGLPTSGTGNIPSFEVTAAGMVTVTINPEYPNGAAPCQDLTGTSFTITGYERPIMETIANITVCAGDPIAQIDFASNVTGATYAWRYVSGDNIGLTILEDITPYFPAIAATVDNATTVLSATYGVKANGGAHCDGPEIFFTITVNPMPAVDTIEKRVFCHGEQVPAYTFTGNVPGTTYHWEFISSTFGADYAPVTEGYDILPSFQAFNLGDTENVLTYQVTALYENNGVVCTGNTEEFIIKLNPIPDMEPISSMMICNNTPVAIDFGTNNITVSSEVRYEWYVDDETKAEAIGMDLTEMGTDWTGTPQGISFTAVNTTDNPITVEITVKYAYWAPGSDWPTCWGEPVVFTITVSPIPEMFEITDQVVCVGEWTAPINFSATGAPAGTKFYWEVDNPSIGLSQFGEGDIPSFEVLADVVATITVHAEYPNGAEPCIDLEGTTFTITGYYRPVMTQLENITVCANEQIEVPDFASTATNPVYDWRFVGGTEVGFGLYGEGNMNAFVVAVNEGTTPIMGVYAVKASEEGYCEGEEIFFVIQVNPLPGIAPVANATYCQGTQVPAHVFTGNTVGATYYWLQTNYGIENIPELPQDGWNILPAFTANNTTIFPITLEYEVTSWFESNGEACEGETTTFTIIINPKPEVVPMPNLSYCNGDDVDPIDFTGPADEYRWMQISGDIITTDQDLFAGGVGQIPGFGAMNTGNTALIAVIHVTPWTEDGLCSGDPIEFTIKVKPTPNVYQVADQKVCAGEHTSDVLFVGDTEGTVFNWTNDHPEIGLGASGTGNIHSFITYNTTTAPITATIEVIPTFKGDPYDACEGEMMTFHITVNPIPEVTPTPDLTFCKDVEVDPITFEGTVPGTVYHWKQIEGPITIGTIDLWAGGVDEIPTFTTINTGNTPLVAVIQVTPIFDEICEGTPITFTITVVPTPTVDQPASQEWCAGAYTYDVIFTGNTPGTIYRWTNDNTSIGLGEEGTGNILSFQTLNTTDIPQIATIVVTPEIIQGDPEGKCIGESKTFYITVNPMPVMNPVSSIIVCSGDEDVEIPFTSSMGDNVIYQWYPDNNDNATTIGLDITATPTTTGIEFDAVNTTDNPITVLVTVTPSSVAPDDNTIVLCTGAPITFSITVNPIPSIFTPADQIVCVGDMTAEVSFGAENAPVGTVFYWSATGDEIGLPLTGGAGNIPPFVVTAAGEIEITVHADYTNASVLCEGDQTTTTFTITGYERPIMTPVEDITVCVTDTTNLYVNTNILPAFESTVVEATYAWRYIAGATDILFIENGSGYFVEPMPLTGTGDFPEFIASNPGNAPLTVVYGVKANGGAHCDGPEIFFAITVNPDPHIDIVANKAYCANQSVSEFTFTGTVPGSIYTWTKMGGDYIGNLPNSGTGVMPPFTTFDNNTDHVLTAYYQVSVTYNYNGIACGNEIQEFSISVLPNATITNLKNGVYCQGDYVEEMPFAGVATTWKWTFMEGQDVGVVQNNGEGQSFPAFYAKNLGDTPIAALFKVVSYYEAEGISCQGAEGFFTIMVNPKPILNTVPADMIYCSGEPVPSYTFTGTYGAVYHWTVTGNPIPGIPNNGTGPFPGFNAYNNGDDIITATVEVWAEYNNYDGTKCASDKQQFTISILPNPIVTNATDRKICEGERVDAYHFSGNVPNTGVMNVTYKWTLLNGEYIGLDATSGYNTIPMFTAKIVGIVPVTARFKVTAYVEYQGKECAGDEFYFSWTVDPLATITIADVDDHGNYIMCKESETADIAYTTTHTGMNMQYTLIFSDKAQAAGFKNIENFVELPKGFFTVDLPKDAPEGLYQATITVRALDANMETCTSSYIFTINLKQPLAIIAQSDATVLVCNEDELVLTVEVSPADAVDGYQWYHNGNAIPGATSKTYSKYPADKTDSGEYYVIVSGKGACSNVVSNTVNVQVNKIVIEQKWDDVLYVDNSEGLYHTYQWYRVIDGIKYPIEGATSQYFSENPLSGTYMVDVLDKYGKTVEASCPLTATHTAKNIITIYPNPVSQGGTLTIQMDMDPEKVSGSIISIYDMVGKQVRAQVVEGKTTNVTMYHIIPGAYVVRITSASGEALKSEKVIVQ